MLEDLDCAEKLLAIFVTAWLDVTFCYATSCILLGVGIVTVSLFVLALSERPASGPRPIGFKPIGSHYQQAETKESASAAFVMYLCFCASTLLPLSLLFVLPHA